MQLPRTKDSLVLRAKDTVDGVLVDTDEDGFHLILSGEKGEYDFRLPMHAAIDLMRAVQTEIVPWAREGGFR